MVLRKQILRSATTLANAFQQEDKINTLGWLSALEIEITATNGSTDNVNNELERQIGSLEVIDGSYALKAIGDGANYAGGVCQSALHQHDTGKVPAHTHDEQANATQRAVFTILFGRWIGDREYAINAKEDFDNLTVRTVGNLANTRAVSATTAYVTGTGRYTLKAWLFDDEVLQPKGWFRTRQIKSWTTAASGDEETTIPDDHEIRRILLRAFLTANNLGIANVDLDYGEGAYHPYDAEDPNQIIRANHANFRMSGEIAKVIDKANDETGRTDFLVSNGFGYHPISTLAATDIAQADAIAADQYTINLVAVATVIANVTMTMGLGYHSSLVLPHDIGGEFLDPTKYGAGKLTATQNGATRAAQVILEEVIRSRGKP